MKMFTGQHGDQPLFSRRRDDHKNKKQTWGPPPLSRGADITLPQHSNKRMGDSNPSPSCPWDGFVPFSQQDLRAETEGFVALEHERATAWEEECAKYEQTMTAVVNGKEMQIPRRNYINKDARVKDPTLFPYHSSCYALLDAYDNLYNTPTEQPVPANAVATTCFPPPPVYMERPRQNEELSSFLPCSVRAISAAIFRLAQVAGLFDPDEILSEYMHLLYAKSVEHNNNASRPSFEELLQTIMATPSLPPIFAPSPIQAGPVPFPEAGPARTELLFKLLQHATSEIQRDHILAQAVQCRLCVEGHLDDVSMFRQVLTLLAAEYIPCDHPCDQAEDHECVDWDGFFQHWVFLFGSHTTTALTASHGLSMAGLVRRLFEREFGHLRTDANHSIGQKMKNQLKRNLILRREDDYADNDGAAPDAAARTVPTQLILVIVSGLLKRALLERQRIHDFLREEEDGDDDSHVMSTDEMTHVVSTDEMIQQSLQSYRVCLSTLLAISEAAVTMLPPVERFYTITSAMVAGLTFCLIGDAALRDRDTPVESYIGVLRDDLEGIVTPFRFAKIVQQNATLRAQRSFPSRDDSPSLRANLLQQCRQILYGQPPDEIRVVVRQLFVCDMVHMQDTWLGYGDFLVWCRYDVHPLDPALFCHEFNYRVDDDEQSEDEEDEDEEDDEEDYQWDVDENGNTLTAPEMRDRFDFTLLALSCAWHEPWKEESHMTFQPGFRTAVFQVAMCLHHVGMPRELHGHIVQYFARDWWPDSRISCWNYDCMLEQLRKQEECRDSGDEYVPPAVKFCICGVAAYCSRSCRENDWKGGGHKRVCGKPPYCRPTAKDYRFCQVIRAKGAGGGELLTNGDGSNVQEGVVEKDQSEDVIIDGDEGDEEDDDGSWESVDSDDEEMEEPSNKTRTATSLTTEFFKAHYKDR